MRLVVYFAFILVLSLLVQVEGIYNEAFNDSSSSSFGDDSASILSTSDSERYSSGSNDGPCIGYIQASVIEASTYPTNVERPAVSSLSNRDLVVVYEAETNPSNLTIGGIFGTLIGASGTIKKKHVELSQFPSSDQQFPSVAAIADGGFVVVWTDSNSAKYRFRFRVIDSSFEEMTEQLSNPYPTPNGTHESRAIAFERVGSGFGIMWREEYVVKAILFDSDGNASTGVVSLAVCFTSIDQYEEPFAIAPLPDGKFVFVYGRLVSQLLDANLNPIGSANIIASSDVPADEPFEPSVVRLVNGGLVVTFAQYSPVNGKEVFARYLNSDATSNGSAFVVNTYESGTQEWSSLSALEDGGFIVNWDSYWQYSKWSLFGRAFGANGSPIGAEFTIMKGVYDSTVAPIGRGFISCGKSAFCIECAFFECLSDASASSSSGSNGSNGTSSESSGLHGSSLSSLSSSSLNVPIISDYSTMNFFRDLEKVLFVLIIFLALLLVMILTVTIVLVIVAISLKIGFWIKSPSSRSGNNVTQMTQRPFFVNEMDQIVVTPTQPIVGVTRQVQPPPYHTIVYPGHPGAPPAYFYAR